MFSRTSWLPIVLMCSLGVRFASADPTSFEEMRTAWEEHRTLQAASLFHGLEWRSVGPVVQGGRVVDIESVPGKPYTFYVAYASAGLWKTETNGVTFEPVFDDQPTLIMGDIAVDPSRPDTVWVGTGENNSSRSSYGGFGVFRSDDGGGNWRYMGLGETNRIGRILVDPRQSDRVFVAALGRLYTPGGQRGVFKTEDGGETWKQVLQGGPWTGAIDLVMDPTNPDILYAATWERSRRPWNFVEGGEGSAIWKSVDRGETWNRLEGGFPRGEHVGRIGLGISASQPRTLYAALDNQELLPQELWDLGDGAVTAKRLRTMTKEEFLAQDPEEIEAFIRSSDLDSEIDAARLLDMVEKDEISLEELIAELDDANASLFQTDIRGLEIWRSDDAGKTWRRSHDDPVRQVVYTYGYYFGQVRVAPDDPERIYVLGVPIITSDDGGKTFSGIDGRDVHVDHHALWIDPQHPQRVLLGNDGGLDVSYDGGKSWIKLDAQAVGQFYTIETDMADPYNIYGGLQDNGVLKGSSRARPGRDTWRRIGGGDGMYVQVDPRDNLTTYLGLQFGFYFRQGSSAPSSVRPRDGLKEEALRYNWATPIHLSRHNPDILYFGANRLFRSMDQGENWTAISPDLTRSEERGDVPFATLTTLAESPLAFGLLWAGTDDGYVHVTEDGGVAWRQVTGGLPADRWVSRVEASHHSREVAYLSLNGYRDDDMRPYLYRTEDLGASWQDISTGLPAEPINVVREDPENPEVLYVGSDRGVYVSLDRGASWQGLMAGLPKVPVHDLKVHPRERELVAGTHGRSVWVLDVLPVQELDAEGRQESARVFPLEEVAYQRFWRRRQSAWFHRPEDAPEIDIPVWVGADGEASLVIADADGNELRRLTRPLKRGVSTFEWDLLLDEEKALEAEAASQKMEEAPREENVRQRKGKKGKGRVKEEPQPQTKPERGALAKTPWAEAVRLGRPLYVTPGTYTVRLETAAGSAETELVVAKPEPLPPRRKKEPPIRGEKKGGQGG